MGAVLALAASLASTHQMPAVPLLLVYNNQKRHPVVSDVQGAREADLLLRATELEGQKAEQPPGSGVDRVLCWSLEQGRGVAGCVS